MAISSEAFSQARALREAAADQRVSSGGRAVARRCDGKLPGWNFYEAEDGRRRGSRLAWLAGSSLAARDAVLEAVDRLVELKRA